jgi:hypothetical protein
MTTIRVFPKRTAHIPDDALAFVGDPPLWRPDADEVHVSCTFTWDKVEAERLQYAWGQYYPKVLLGGPAFDSPCDTFTPGMYVKQGITYTSRGCTSSKGSPTQAGDVTTTARGVSCQSERASCGYCRSNRDTSCRTIT